MHGSIVRSSRVRFTIIGLLVAASLFPATREGLATTSQHQATSVVQADSTAGPTVGTLLPGGVFGWD